MTFSDSRNYFSGNPDLDPEFSNVFELGHIKYFERGSFTSAVYHRSTRGVSRLVRLLSIKVLETLAELTTFSFLSEGGEVIIWLPRGFDCRLVGLL